METTKDSAVFERDHVHAVYDSIASDFSRTRHTRWPFVERFMFNLPAGSVVLDSGCGNGKYLGCRTVLTTDQAFGAWSKKPAGEKEADSTEPVAGDAAAGNEGRIMPIGLDMSQGLLSIASGKGHEAVRGNCFDVSFWRPGSFDHAISIATIHHFSTPSRRMKAIKQLILAVLPPPPSPTQTTPPRVATVLVVVWALEQDPKLLGVGSARRKKGAVPVPVEQLAELDLDSGSRPPPVAKIAPAGTGGEKGDGGLVVEEEQDVFVSWQLQAPQVRKPKISSVPKSKRPHPPSATSPSSVAQLPLQPDTEVAAGPPATPEEPRPVFNRYYHLFRSGELSDLVHTAAAEVKREDGGWETSIEILDDGEIWDRENWAVRIAVTWRRMSTS